MNLFSKPLLILCIAASFLIAAGPDKKKGVIIYLDGIPASGKSSVAKELSDQEYFKYLSSDEYAEKNNVPYYKSAVLMFKKAIEIAKSGERVILDSFMVEDFFLEKESPDFDIVTIGVWCPLSCLKERFDARTNKKDAYKDSHLEADYRSRYEEKISDDIIKDNGSFRYNAKFIMHYDLFLNSENSNSKILAKKIIHYLDKRYKKPSNTDLKKK